MKTKKTLITRVDEIKQYYNIGIDKNRSVEDRASGKLTYIEASAGYLYTYKPKSIRKVYMYPSVFLGLAAGRPGFQDVIEDLKDKILSRTPLDPLFFDVDIDTGKVLAHEGRHRAKTAQELGIEKVPVILYFKKLDKESGKRYYCDASHLHGTFVLKPEQYGYETKVNL